MCVISIQEKVIKQRKVDSNKQSMQKADEKGPDMNMITPRFTKFINQYTWKEKARFYLLFSGQIDTFFKKV